MKKLRNLVALIVLTYFVLQYLVTRAAEPFCFTYNTRPVITWSFTVYCYGFHNGTDYYFPPWVLLKYDVPALHTPGGV